MNNDKRSLQEEDITFANIYAPNIGAPKYIKLILTDIMGEIDNNILIIGKFNTSLTSMDRSSRQKVNKATGILNNTIDQLDLIDIYKTKHPKKPENTFLSSVHGMLSRIDHILGSKQASTNLRG